ncbi:MAG: hypothetical protein HY670_00680 [Chloroflexi bacterium]|nr:hypothetical protein [Chloroflexota bacterium]
MKTKEAGFTFLEILLAAAAAIIILGGAVMLIFQTTRIIRDSNDGFTALQNAASAASWVSRDTRMADSIMAEDLPYPEILAVAWTEWGFGTDSVYHSVTYAIAGLSGDIGTLKRMHQSSTGLSEETIIANNIYYDPALPGVSTSAIYQGSMLSLKVVVLVGEVREVREYQIYHRPDFRGD